MVEGVDIDESTGEIVVSCRPRAKTARRCGHCSRRARARYDPTSIYFERSTRPSAGFASGPSGYSRDKGGVRPQVVIGLLCTGDGLPIASHVFAGNTADVSTLPGVLDDL